MRHATLLTGVLAVAVALSMAALPARAAKEDISFVAEHLPEVAMDDRYARLPLWDPADDDDEDDSEEADNLDFSIEPGYLRLGSSSLVLNGPTLTLSVSRRWGGWHITAFGFRDQLSYSGGIDRRPLDEPFVATPIDMPVAAEFSNFGGRMTDTGAGIAFRRHHEHSWFGPFDWSVGLMWQEVRLSDNALNYRALEGPDAGATGVLDFSATYRHFSPFVGVGKTFGTGDFRFTPHVQYAVPLPRRGVRGHITGPGFDLSGDSADNGAGKHFGDMSVTFGFDIAYMPWDLTLDAGTAVSQALFEPLIHEGIDQNWVIELRWVP